MKTYRLIRRHSIFDPNYFEPSSIDLVSLESPGKEVSVYGRVRLSESYGLILLEESEQGDVRKEGHNLKRRVAFIERKIEEEQVVLRSGGKRIKGYSRRYRKAVEDDRFFLVLMIRLLQ